MPATVSDTLTFILDSASETDLDRIIDAIKRRRRALTDIRSAQITTGSTVTLINMKPKYLSGLSGKVERIEGGRAEVLLDASSTDALRFTRQTRFAISDDQERFLLRGVPLAGCRPASPS